MLNPERPQTNVDAGGGGGVVYLVDGFVLSLLRDITSLNLIITRLGKKQDFYLEILDTVPRADISNCHDNFI